MILRVRPFEIEVGLNPPSRLRSPGNTVGNQESSLNSQSEEPVLFPRLRTQFADFPFPHLSIL